MALLSLGALTAAALVRSPNAISLVHCGADETRPDATVLALGLGGSPLPVPAHGVVTGWRVVGGSAQGRFEQRLQVFRRVDGPVNSFLAVAESSAEVAPDGPRHYFKTRIPVESGDLFALQGTAKTFVCDGVVGVTSSLHQGPTPIGSSYAFKAEEGLGVPLDVVIEPDEDGDGHGDRTQDRCTRMPSTQDDCPAIELRVKGVVVKARSILVSVTAGTKAKALAHVEIRWRFKPPGSDYEALEIATAGGGVKRLRPGRSTRLKIELSRVMLQQLSRMPPERSLKAKITINSLSVAGREVERKLTVRLPGRKRM